MTSMADELGYGWALDLSNPAWVHELRDPHTGEWINSPGDIKFPPAQPGPAGSVDRYVVPDPARLREVKSGYKNPADHPFWREHPISPENIVAAYDAADEGARAQGRRWYADVSDLANKITGGNPEQGGILLSTYSPQTSWPINMFNAAESARRGHAIGPGEGIKVTTQQKEKAQKALDGQGVEELMQTAKTHSFGVLIAHGDDAATDPYGHVVVDTHAVNVALGGTMRGKALEKAPISDARQHEYVADQYRQAAKIISEREGKLMKPHELQAITWLAQQRANQGLDAAEMTPLQKGRVTMTKNAWKRWMTYADEHGIPVVIGSTGIEMAQQALLAQVIDLIGGDSLWAQLTAEPPPFPDGSLAAQALDLAFNPAEPRDPHTGKWITLWHGAHHDDIPGIKAGGISPSSRGTTLTSDRLKAEAVAQTRDWNDPKVVQVRIPAAEAGRYLDEQIPGEFALKQPLPASHVAGVHTVQPAWKQAREAEYQQRLAERQASQHAYPVIGPEHARGNSRPVSHDEFQQLAREGNRWIDQAKQHSAPITGLDGPGWGRVKARAYAEASKSWGGETIDTGTGEPLPQGADLFALSVKPRGMDTVSVPETATAAEFGQAMDQAKDRFRTALERRSFYLGVFHDDEHGRIDIDPVAIVNSNDQVERVGAYTRAIGGAYRFSDGNGYWPPHVPDSVSTANDDDDQVHFEGPGQWHAQAVAVQEPEPDDTPDED
jgi:hypothetical protein